MEENRVKSLLNKYWEGETSLEEEKELHSYFQSAEVKDEFRSIQPLFAFFSEAGEMKMQGDVKLLEKDFPKRKVVNLRWIINVAASLAIFFALFFVNKKDDYDSQQFVYEDTYEDPEQAYAQVKEALLFLSGKMNKGMNTASTSLEKIRPLEEIVK